MKKKWIALTACLAIFLSLHSGKSLAYYTTDVVASNIITSGSVAVKIHESDVGSWQILPGDTVDKSVCFENIGTAPLYLRVQLVKSVENSMLSAEACIDIDLNDKYWTFHNGYYYYNYVLNPGEITGDLFTQIYFDGKLIDNTYIGKALTVDITVFAVQSDNNGDTVWDAVGWPDKES